MCVFNCIVLATDITECTFNYPYFLCFGVIYGKLGEINDFNTRVQGLSWQF